MILLVVLRYLARKAEYRKNVMYMYEELEAPK